MSCVNIFLQARGLPDPNGEVGGENDAFGCVIALEKLRRCVGRRGKIIEIAIDLEDDIRHGRKVSDAEDRYQLFAQDEAGSHYGSAEEAHGPHVFFSAPSCLRGTSTRGSSVRSMWMG